MRVLLCVLSALLALRTSKAFQPSPFRPMLKVASRTKKLQAADDNDSGNPYQDENYPELEFIDYSDPEYVVDQGVSEYFAENATEELIEQMREDRRRRNDEFQFETYFERILKSGEEYFGEWTLYKTSTFMEDGLPGSYPRVIQARQPIKVKSRGYKISVETESEYRVDGERIIHEEIQIEHVDDKERTPEAKQIEDEIMSKTYWPEQLQAYDFRGSKGIMCVGAAHTICSAIPLLEGATEHEGPFAEMRTEVGISDGDLRMRIKLDYSVFENEMEAFKKSHAKPPPLHLKSIAVCRELKGKWPNNAKDTISVSDMLASEALFGIPGASGGLYDPPPVGSEQQAGQYMMLDLEGGATVLLPFLMDQDPDAHDGYGWVTSLDWTPGRLRYQVDRKVLGGKSILGLRTLELSEVQGKDAERYRPRDGGSDMRQ